MNLKSNIVTLLICAMFAFSCGTFAGGLNKKEFKKMTNSEKAKMILEKSTKKMLTDHIIENESDGVRYVTYWKKAKDGRILLKVDFSFCDEKGKEISSISSYTNLVINGQVWWIIKNYALKEPQISPLIEKKTNKDNVQITSYSIEEKTIDGTECYIISSKIKDSKEKVLKKITQEIIRKSDFANIGSSDYDRNGRMTRNYKVKTIVFKTLDKQLFILPDDKILKIFKNHKQFQSFFDKLLFDKQIELDD